MVNHFRTLLLNRAGKYVPETINPYDIHIPSYDVVEYTDAALDYVTFCFFGDCLTDEDRDKRTFQLLKVVDSSDLSSAITEVDGRLTYDLRVNTQEKSPMSIKVVADHFKEYTGIVSRVLEGEDDLITKYKERASFVDRLACVLVAYVRKLDALR